MYPCLIIPEKNYDNSILTLNQEKWKFSLQSKGMLNTESSLPMAETLLKCWGLGFLLLLLFEADLFCFRMMYIAVTDRTQLLWNKYVIIHTPTKSGMSLWQPFFFF